MKSMAWYVYMLRCVDDTFYTGITTDISRRVTEHNLGVKGKGAKYTAARKPVILVYKKRCKDRSSAAKTEAALKKLRRKEKLILKQNYGKNTQ